MRKSLVLLLLPLHLFAQNFTAEEVGRWQKQAKQVTIIRDNYGVPHIYGKSDADAVFGLMYAQCEDDFRRIEMNYLEKLGKLSLVKGESELYNDLLNAIVLNPDDAKADYQKAPAWLKKLCNAFADGINYYLYKHPASSLVLNRFEPWFPLLWTDGSIGAINTAGINGNDLKNLYGGGNGEVTIKRPSEETEEVLTGSNGFAFSPKITESGNAILYINPHVTFYFRPEVHVVSDEGLNAYGAVTWGQFFVYQGFNEHCGWMHTSSQVDAADAYIEKMSHESGKWTYEYNNKRIPAKERKIQLSYKSPTGEQSKTYTILYTGHGPVMAKEKNDYLSVRADNRLMNGLIQCWQRTKSKSFSDFKKTLDLLGNISNNTVYADADGNIAYWHGNRIPVRDPRFDWSKPVDGTTPATEWKGYHKVNETVHLSNPPNGWLQNCNSTPYSVAGVNSPKKSDYPAYMAPDGENFRGINAVRVLDEEKHYTIDKVIKAGYDRRLTAFEVLVPALIKAFDNLPASDSIRNILTEPINVLRGWDYRCGENSVATTLAVYWGTLVQSAMNRLPGIAKGNDQVEKTINFAGKSPATLLGTFSAAIDLLNDNYQSWKIEWGVINRFQRISSDIDSKFDDSQPSIPVGFVSSQWGMLPSFASRTFPGTKKRYGYNGNSFICAVEFGKIIKAKSLLTSGESGNPNSPHFKDQAQMYSKGQFKDVLFYKDDVLKNAEKTYHPGE